ncbi:putative dihydroxyacetone kinase [Ixodes scapularis]
MFEALPSPPPTAELVARLALQDAIQSKLYTAIQEDTRKPTSIPEHGRHVIAQINVPPKGGGNVAFYQGRRRLFIHRERATASRSGGSPRHVRQRRSLARLKTSPGVRPERMPREEFKSPRDVPLARHKFINSPETCVQDSLQGFVAVNPGVRLLRQCGAVVRHDLEQLGGKVTLVAGGGSGHEPGFSGFIGEGFLTAAVAGPIYTSPFSDNILATLRTVGANNKAGVLTFVCNYTGDRLTFGIAIEKARAEGIQVDMVLIAEDTALPHTFPSTGRRGLCGAVFMMKAKV